MFIHKILLKNFRNFSDSEFLFKNNLNFILGKNGAGKTSILEAIHYLAFSKSFRTNSDNEAIKNESEYFQIFGDFTNTEKDYRVNLNYVKKEGKRIIINNAPLEKMKEIVGKFPVVSLSPDNEKITKGSPLERRIFIDKILSQSDHEYFENLIKYNRSLKNRNRLLKQSKEQKKFIYDILFESLDELLIQDAFKLVQKRKNFLKEYNTIFQDEIKKVSHFNYHCQLKIKSKTPIDDENFYQNYRNKLKEKILKDIILSRTSYGPHLDNIDVYFDNKEIKKVASQGEHKIVLIALKMAEGKYLQKKLNVTVIYLLDDLFALLDSDHCVRTIDEISNDNQTIVTSTSLDHLEQEKERLKNYDYGIIQLNGI
ncbi:MAG: DNA replication and repair protein RecF [Candidatus Marinimicrobia bacterium]|nr:DNA replication and repair protein RecF [Candidatus Neomarinimicrobiota bacterium]